MNSKVCVVTIILFLSLENVSGLICNSILRNKPKQEEQPSTEKPEDKCSKETWDVTCNPQKLCHEWHQRYQNGGLEIGTANIQKWGKRTRLTIKVEKFDENTEIYCENRKETTERPVQNQIVNAKINSNLSFDSYDDERYKKLIKIKDNETWEKDEEPPYHTIIYSKENENVKFSCPEPSNTTYIQLGLLNTTSNTIKTFGSTRKTLNIKHNGTILCCIFYVMNETAKEMLITRVVNKTLLHYNDTARPDYLVGKEVISNTNTTTGTDSDADQGHQNIIITTAVAGVFILLVIIVLYCITCKKCCRKKPQSEDKVVYADLDILRQIQPDSPPSSGPAEECPYAQIIGEMRPQTT